MSGTFVAIVGPSGAGKDTVMRIARDRLTGEPRIHFVRRAITRPVDTHEDHEPVSPADFATRLANGNLALHWHAHGLSYGLPASALQRIERGHVVVANVSRTVVPDIVARYPRHLVVEVTADEAVRAARVAGRGRSSDGGVLERVTRTVTIHPGADRVVIRNDDAPELAGSELASLLLRQLGREPSRD